MQVSKGFELFEVLVDTAIVANMLPKAINWFRGTGNKTATGGASNAVNAAAMVTESRDNIFTKKDDKMRLMAHIFHAYFKMHVDAEQVKKFNLFLANATTKERTTFRDAFLSHDKWEAKQEVIVSLMRMETDDERRTAIAAVGLNDPTLFDELRTDFKEPYNALLEWGKKDLAELEQRKLDRTTKKAKKKPVQTGLWAIIRDSFGFNFFR